MLIGIPAQGFPSKSMIDPPILPSCAAARGALQLASPSNKIAASADAFKNFSMLHSPLLLRSPGPGIPAGLAHYLSSAAVSNGFRVSSRPAGSSQPVRNRICNTRFGKSPQAQQAAVARPARFFLSLIARPSEMQRCAQVESPPHDFALLHADYRSHHFNPRFGLCASANQLLKHAVIFRPAIRIPGAVFLHGADVNRTCADGLGPAHRGAQKVSIAEGHVGYGDGARPRLHQLILGYLNLRVCERGAADCPKMVELDHQPLSDAVKIGNLLKGAPFSLLRPLAIACVE